MHFFWLDLLFRFRFIERSSGVSFSNMLHCWRLLYMAYRNRNPYQPTRAWRDTQRIPKHTSHLMTIIVLPISHVMIKTIYRKVSKIRRTKCFSSHLVVVFTQSVEVRCYVENEDVVGAAPTGDAPTTSEWSTIWLPTKVRLIIETWLYIYFVLLSSSNRKYELLPIVLGLGHETMVCAVCLSIFLWSTNNLTVIKTEWVTWKHIVPHIV